MKVAEPSVGHPTSRFGQLSLFFGWAAWQWKYPFPKLQSKTLDLRTSGFFHARWVTGAVLDLLSSCSAVLVTEKQILCSKQKNLHLAPPYGWLTWADLLFCIVFGVKRVRMHPNVATNYCKHFSVYKSLYYWKLSCHLQTFMPNLEKIQHNLNCSINNKIWRINLLAKFQRFSPLLSN